MEELGDIIMDCVFVCDRCDTFFDQPTDAHITFFENERKDVHCMSCCTLTRTKEQSCKS